MVIAPLRSLSPLECSEGVSPSHAANDLALLNLENSPASKTMSAAVMTSMPFRQRRESILFFHLGLDASSATSFSNVRVNVFFTDSTNAFAPLAPTHFHQFDQRTFTVSG